MTTSFKKPRLVLVALLLGVGIFPLQSFAEPSKDAIASRAQVLQNRSDIATTQWYDINEKGVLLGAPQAAGFLRDAQAATASGDLKGATALLDKADALLSQYTKPDLPPYQASTSMKNPTDLGKIHKATIADIKQMSFFDVPRWNYWFNFVGTGSDGNKYMAYAYVNHHGTGKIVLPIVFAMSSSANPTKIDKVNFNTLPVFKEEKDRISYTVIEGDKSLIYTVADGKVSIAYKDATRSVTAAATTKYSFWYNKNVDYALILPGAPMAGFEETGKAEATFILDGKKITAKGFAESENLFCGGAKGADYRTALIKYGNEWWVPFRTEGAEGIFVMTGSYKDAGLYIGGKYMIPSSFTVTPIEANKSFRIDANTPAGPLSLTFSMWGWDPLLYEHWGTVEGTLAGKKLGSGYSWLEHIPQGGQNGSPPVDGRKGSHPAKQITSIN